MEDARAFGRSAGGVDEDPGGVRGELELRSPAERDPVVLPLRRGRHRERRRGGQTVVAAGPVDDPRADPDRRHLLLGPEDPREPLARLLVHAVEGDRMTGRVVRHGAAVVVLPGVDRRREAVFGVVGDADRLRLAVGADD